MEHTVFSVSQINDQIQSTIEGNPVLTSVAIRGELSNYKMYPSGHHYFTLKDENSSLKCVMFKSNAMRLRFQPSSGMKVIALGRISVYARDGVYQLYCTAMTIDGIGDLHAAFEQLKIKLDKLGLFDSAHKKPIPKQPGTIGIVTSSAGAAIHDILRILNKRWPLVVVRLFPVRVQGAEAPEEIAAAIRFANLHRLADVLIVGRGGGSIEDLWAFNDERVAYAIFESKIPVISAVGHEPDVTISDYVADLRAATPSNAAELAVPDQNSVRQYLDQVSESMAASLSKMIKSSRFQVNTLASSAVLKSHDQYYEQKRRQLQIICDRLTSASDKYLESKKHKYLHLAAALDAMSPLKVLSRGYAIASDPAGNVIKSVSQLKPGAQIDMSLYDGSVTAEVLEVKEKSNEQ